MTPIWDVVGLFGPCFGCGRAIQQKPTSNIVIDITESSHFIIQTSYCHRYSVRMPLGSPPRFPWMLDVFADGCHAGDKLRAAPWTREKLAVEIIKRFNIVRVDSRSKCEILGFIGV